MFVRINNALRNHKQLLAIPAILLVAAALAATHSSMTGSGQEHSSHHGGGVTTAVMILCLAVLETGVAIALGVASLAAARRTPMLVNQVSVASATAPARLANGPPLAGRSLLQVFLR